MNTRQGGLLPNGGLPHDQQARPGGPGQLGHRHDDRPGKAHEQALPGAP